MRTRRMTPAVGIEVTGLDVSQAASEAMATLRSMLVEHGVVVLRGQHMTRGQQVRLAAGFGQPDRLPSGLPDHPEVVRIEHGPDSPPTENIWHADLSFLVEPPMGTVLRAVELPETGGDTLFADMRDLWLRLPEPIRDTLGPLNAEHDIAKWAPPERADELHTTAPVRVHPVVRVHPETGESILFVNPAYTTRIVELSPPDSDAMLDYLFRQISVPEVQCRVRWEPGTAVIWDNRSVVHYAAGDYLPHRRVMERITIAAPPVAQVTELEAASA